MKLSEAYAHGTNFKELPEGSKRRHRWAYSLGALAGRRALAYNENLAASQVISLEKAIEATGGPHKAALEIIKESARLVQPGEHDPSIRIQISQAGKQRRNAWFGALHAGADRDPSRPSKLPIFDLPLFVLDGEEIPVDNLAIAVSIEETDNRLTGPVTTIWLNSREYNPDNEPQPEPFTDELRIDINANDGMTLRRSVHGAEYGMDKVVPRETNVLGFLAAARSCVEKTAAEYERLRTAN